MEDWDLWIDLSFVFCQIVNLSGMCRREGARFLRKEMFIYATVFFQFKYWKYFFQAYSKWGRNIAKVFWSRPPDPLMFSGPCVAQSFSICNNIFPLFYQFRLFYFKDTRWRWILNFYCRYVPVVAFVQYIFTNTVVVAS